MTEREALCAAFFHACHEGDVAAFRDCLSQAGVSIRVNDELHGFSPSRALLIVCEQGHKHMLQELFRKKVDSTVTLEGNGDSALHILVRKGFIEMLKNLLSRGVKPECVNKEGYTPLLLACHLENAAAMDCLLSQRCNPLSQDLHGHTILHLAARKRSKEILHVINRYEMTLDTPNHAGYTPLHTAIVSGSLECVKWLITKGALISAQTREGYSALHLAALYGRSEIACFILNAIQRKSQLDDASAPSSKASSTSFASMMSVGSPRFSFANVFWGDGSTRSLYDMEDNSGYTALMYAACAGLTAVVLWLIEAEATVSNRTRTGMTLLHLMVKKGSSVSCIESLLRIPRIQRMVDDKDNSEGVSPRDLVESGHKDVLLAYKNDPNILDALKNLMWDAHVQTERSKYVDGLISDLVHERSQFMGLSYDDNHEDEADWRIDNSDNAEEFDEDTPRFPPHKLLMPPYRVRTDSSEGREEEEEHLSEVAKRLNVRSSSRDLSENDDTSSHSSSISAEASPKLIP